MTFDDAFMAVIGAEGGYVNHPADPGGETMYGISKRSYPNEDIKNLTLARAKEIYKKDYWDAIKGDQLPYAVARLVFDCAVNMGVKTAIIIMQKCLGVSTDGLIGNVTLATAQAFEPARFTAHFNAARIDYYCMLPTFATFGKGWMHRVAEQLRSA
jgi:lysozyme family protein